MAKTKEQVIDLKPKAKKVTKEELNQLQRVVNDNNALQFRVGALEGQKHLLLHELANVQNEVKGIQAKFKEQYGSFDVDLHDGTINYEEDGE